MDENEVKNYIFLMWSDKLTRTSVLLILILSLFLSVSLSFFTGALILVSYIGGFVAFNSIFRHRTEAPNLLSLLTGRNRGTAYIFQHKSCSVCGDGSCTRHKPTSYMRQPWVGLDIPVEVDEAIEDFLNKTLSEYVYSWYSDLSRDESFVQELRHSIRYAASVVLRQGLQVDLANLITSKLIPAGLGHMDDYLGSLRLAARQKLTLDRATVQFLGSRLHPAVKNRERELNYLRQLVSMLLPQLLPPSQLACSNYQVLIRELLSGWVLLPLADVLADPAIVNSLLLLLLEKHTLTQYPDKPPVTVEFLDRFVSSVPAARGSALHLDLSSVLKNQQLLYPFMQFLKSEGSVNVLQFCLDVEEFNRKMLTPDLGKLDLENLYREAWDLFSVYFSPVSPDRILFNPAVVEGMRRILQEPPESIVKLRTTPPLFQAYEYAYSLLENNLCPLFHQSDDYYMLLCGQRLPSGYSKSGSRVNKKWSDSGTVARISNKLNKIKGALRSQPVEGHTFDSDSTLDLGETEFAEDLHLSESSTQRDLNAWRVSIPSVDTRFDINNKTYPVFNINVQRIDINTEEDPERYHWTVDRKYNDFYALESKLTEFHGEFTDTHLPPKRILFGPRGVEFMETKRQNFEDFLQRLLQKPNLRGSDLLHAFLRSSADFVPASSTGLVGAVPEGLGRMIRRSVPIRLRKERGQHLDTFLNSFVQSTEAGKTKPSKYEWKDVTSESKQRVRCLTKSVFKDNFGIPSDQPLPVVPSLVTGSSNVSVHGIFDCVLYLVVRVFGAPQVVVRLAMAARAVLQNTINALVNFYLDRKLRKLLVPPRLGHLIHLLQGAVFNPRSSPISANELEARAGRALEHLQNVLPGWLVRLMGPGYKIGLLTIFTAVQSPSLNKQASLESPPILPGDGLPAQVCHKCVFQINTSYDFIQVCENSDMKLRQFLAGFKLGAKSLFQNLEVKREGQMQGMDTPIKSGSSDLNMFAANDRPHHATCDSNKNQESLTDMSGNSSSSREDDKAWDPFGKKKKQPDINTYYCPSSPLPVPCHFLYGDSKNRTVHNNASLPELGEGCVSNSSYSCLVGMNVFPQDGHLKCFQGRLAEKQFKCDICEKTFTQNSSLNIHMKLHRGQKDYTCQICSRSFAQNSSLKSHIRLHTGQKPFSCPFCTKAFAQQSNLRSHVRIHTGEKPFCCFVCKKTFTQRSSLNNHVKTTHGVV
uniref:Sorting nexin 14 n=1 Tax=Timema shepardi TaxID=629360 RepID=A0A7R9AWQ5_TIMSH|nr:unnamed protein product [Timema shepardi]